MISKGFTELHRLATHAVVYTRPFALDSKIRVATEAETLLTAALDARSHLVSARAIAVQCGIPAARAVRDHTQHAFDALDDLIAECRRELGEGEARSG